MTRTKEQLSELMSKLRDAKEAKNLSYQRIADLTEENGEAVSITTVKRVFQKDSDLENFRYNNTIRPIVRAVLGMDEEHEPPAENEPEQAEQFYTIEALKSVVDFKHQQIEILTAENERLKSLLSAGSNDAVLKTESDAQKKIDYLKGIIDDLKNSIKWYKKAIAILAAIVGVVFVALLADVLIGSIGWIRY